MKNIAGIGADGGPATPTPIKHRGDWRGWRPSNPRPNVGAPAGANAAAQPNMSKFKTPSTPLPPQFLPVYHSPPPFFTAPRCSPEKRPLLDGKGMTPRPPRPFARTPCRMPRTSLAISTRTTPRSRGTPTTKRRKPAMPPQQAACCGTSPPTSSKTPQDNSVTASFSSPPCTRSER